MTPKQRARLAVLAAESGDAELMALAEKLTIEQLPASDRNGLDAKLDRLTEMFSDPGFIDHIKNRRWNEPMPGTKEARTVRRDVNQLDKESEDAEDS